MNNLHFESTTEALETLRMAADAAAIGIWDWNVVTEELHWSGRCKAIFGLPSQVQVRYPDFLERLDPNERELVALAVRRALDPQGSGLYDIEYRIIRPNGEVRWAASKGRAFFAEVAGQRRAVRFLGTILDRTEQKRSQEVLIQSERLAATGRLAAAIVHEIRNPLSTVRDLIYLAKQARNEEDRSEFLEQASVELTHVEEIAANTLRFYRDPAGVTGVDISELVRSVTNLFSMRCTLAKIDITTEFSGHITVLAGSGELRQVIVNLIDNALDAMAKGGRIRLRLRSYPDGVTGSSPLVVLSVADRGQGMTSAVLARISEPFYTTKGESGNGIGLWLSREILAKYGFRMRVKSKVGVGSVFSLFMREAPGA